MGILLGISAAIFWGFGDFFARSIALRIGSYSTLFFIQFIGMLGLGTYLISTGGLQHMLSANSWVPWAWALFAVVLNIAASLCLYRAFESGALILASPIASSYAAITVILSIISGETLSATHGLGILLVLLGVIFVSTPLSLLTRKKKTAILHQPGTLRSILWALGSAFGYGATFWVLGFHVTSHLGGLIPVWLIRTLTPIILLGCAPLFRQKLVRPVGHIWTFVVLVGFLDTLGYISYTFGQLAGQIAIVTIMSSLYSAVTVLLAFFFLREKLQPVQWLATLLIFSGIVFVNL